MGEENKMIFTLLVLDKRFYFCYTLTDKALYIRIRLNWTDKAVKGKR